MSGTTWLAVLDPAAGVAAVRSQLHEVPLAPSVVDLPAPGDHVAVLSLPAVRLIGIAVVGSVRPGPVLHLRDRIRAPVGHAVDPYAMRPLPSFAVDLTRDRLAALAGSPIRLSVRDASRVAGALRAEALAFGPRPSRPAHSRPRTPGRRALMEGRAASGTLRARVR